MTNEQLQEIEIKKPILDACCGSRMFWFDKNNPNVIFMDNRQTSETLCDGRSLIVNPDVMADFRNIPYPDNSFKIVVFDPPHLLNVGESSWLCKKYGKLNKTWQNDLKRGIDECFRVLDIYGILIFKWNEEQIKLNEVLSAIGRKPLIGDKRSKTHWIIFMKGGAT